MAAELLIVIATVVEARAFLAARGLLTTVERFEGVGWPSIPVGKDCQMVISGIGRANAAAATAWAVATQQWAGKSVVNVGIAGTLADQSAALGDSVLATSTVFVEEGIFVDAGWCDMCNGLGFPLNDKTWARGNAVRCDESLNSEIAHKLRDDVLTQGIIATVATCSGTDEAAEEVVRRTQAVAEGMEGAAVVATAKILGCSATELRVISNTCGERARQQWEMKNALTKLHHVLDALVD